MMKRNICLAMMAAMLLMAVPAKAQFSWGLKGGVNLGNKSLPELSTEGQTLKLNNYAGFFVGPKAEVRIPVIGLGVEAAAMYAQNSMELTSKAFKQGSFQIPVNLKYSIGLGNMANIFFAAGPEFGFYVGKTDLTKYIADEYALSVNVGLGVTLFKHVQLGANYNMPCDDTLRFRYGMVQVSAAYLF